MTDRVLLRAAEIAAMAGLAKTHFLNTRARRVNRSLGDATGLEGLGIHLIEVQPGDVTTEHHVHHHEDEACYILSGTADAHIGDAVEPVGPGDFLGYRAGGVAHSLEATGTEPLRVLVIGQRLPHDVADYPRKSKRIFRNEGLPWTLVAHDALETVQAGKKTED
ncbi:cupin domain-containing protein [uncultured Jannaschia sp.]|uniref:cupin domain-containing protein n=1 Tax=uncultured Jannaschia sp. TaxID=293347 RepID=UPI002637CBDE|nr:cupin domain-containing protein [uncultured Jannaschia sp.]